MARQVNGENTARARDVADSENAVVCLDVAPTDGQSEPDTSAVHAALCERQKQLFGGRPAEGRRSDPRPRSRRDHRARRSTRLRCRRCVNLNAFCSRFSTAERSISRSASTSRPGSTSATVNGHSRASASSDADSSTLATKSVTEINSLGLGSPAVTRVSASDRSIRRRNPSKERSSIAPVAPASPTLPVLIVATASIAVWVRPRRSCANEPSRSLCAKRPRRHTESRCAANSVTASAIPLSRQRLRVRNSSTCIGETSFELPNP